MTTSGPKRLMSLLSKPTCIPPPQYGQKCPRPEYREIFKPNSPGLTPPRSPSPPPVNLKPKLQKQEKMFKGYRYEPEDAVDIESEEERSEDEPVCCAQCAKELKQPIFCSRSCQVDYDELIKNDEEGEKPFKPSSDDDADESDGSDEIDGDGDSVMSPSRIDDLDDESGPLSLSEDDE